MNGITAYNTPSVLVRKKTEFFFVQTVIEKTIRKVYTGCKLIHCGTIRIF